MKTVSTTYESREDAHTRKPVEIYRLFTEQSDESWYYTSGDFPITFSGVEYTPATIDRSEVSYNNNLDSSTMTLRIAYLEDPVLEYVSNSPVDLMWVEVALLFRDQTPYEKSIIFMGLIRNVRFQGNQAEAEVVGFEYILQQPIPKWRFSPRCNTYLFSDTCGLDKDTYKVSTVVSGVDDLLVTCSGLDAQADGYYSRGYVEKDYQRSMIVAHDDNVIELRYPIVGLEAGDTLDVYPGCNGDLDTCVGKFSNLNNFRGYPYIPLDNPVMWI